MSFEVVEFWIKELSYWEALAQAAQFSAELTTKSQATDDEEASEQARVLYITRYKAGYSI